MTTKYLGDNSRKLGGTSKMKGGGGGNTRKVGQSSQRKNLFFLFPLRRRKDNGRPN